MDGEKEGALVSLENVLRYWRAFAERTLTPDRLSKRDQLLPLNKDLICSSVRSRVAFGLKNPFVLLTT